MDWLSWHDNTQVQLFQIELPDLLCDDATLSRNMSFDTDTWCDETQGSVNLRLSTDFVCTLVAFSANTALDVSICPFCHLTLNQTAAMLCQGPVFDHGTSLISRTQGRTNTVAYVLTKVNSVTKVSEAG